ncbi:MAG: tetratricopeptide repeat protein [Planctomycetaceae bacterium]|nr:tetratricopeptide repeat protein [Planctomycetaceae bacterium]
MKRAILILWFTIVTVGGPFAWFWGRSSLESLRDLGLQKLKEGDDLHAGTLLEEWLKDHPDDFTVRGLLVDSYRSSGRSQDAIRHLKQLVEAPRNQNRRAEHLRILAATASQVDDFLTAEYALKEILKDTPDAYAANLALAELYFRTERSTDALPYIEKSISANPGRAHSYLLMAEALSECGRHVEMVPWLEKCVELEPGLLAARANLAFAYQASGRTSAAIQEAEICLQQDPENVAVQFILAQCLRDEGRSSDSLQIVQSILKTQPMNLDAALLEADLLFFMKRADEAYEHLRPLAEHFPENRPLINHLMRAAALRGDRSSANHWKDVMERLLKAP